MWFHFFAQTSLFGDIRIPSSVGIWGTQAPELPGGESIINVTLRSSEKMARNIENHRETLQWKVLQKKCVLNHLGSWLKWWKWWKSEFSPKAFQLFELLSITVRCRRRGGHESRVMKRAFFTLWDISTSWKSCQSLESATCCAYWASKNWNGLHGCTFSPSLSAKGSVTKGSTGPLEVDNVWELLRSLRWFHEGKISRVCGSQSCQGASGTFSCSLAAKLTWKMPRSKVKVQSLMM